LLAERLPQLSWVPPEATFLAWLDTSAIGPDDTARDLFLDRGRIALEPGLRFGAPGAAHVRLNFGTSAEIIDEAVTRMAAALAG
jgi:cystathionine beta-lyase